MTENMAEDRNEKNRLDSRWLDAALNLLDRQVVDSDGMLVCNVDDLEITDRGGTDLAVTAILVGAPALVPRFSGKIGGWLLRTWIHLGVQYADRDRPMRIGLDLVRHVGSDIELMTERQGLLDRQSDAAVGIELRRMDDLLGMDVVLNGNRVGEVIDVRLEPRRQEGRMVVRSLVVGRGRPGSMLGYDRGDFNGPWLVAKIVRWLHRHTGEVGMDAVSHIDWENSRVEISRAPGPLERR